MSLKFFFNRNGKVVSVLALLGWAILLWNLAHLSQQWELRGGLTSVTYMVLAFFTLLVTAARLIPWYKPEDRGHGIEEHFSKNMVVLSYCLLVVHVVYSVWMACWPLLFIITLFFGVLNVVNGILLYLYFHDHDSTPPSYFSRSLYMTSEKATLPEPKRAAGI